MAQRRIVGMRGGDLITDKGEVLAAADHVFMAVPRDKARKVGGWFMAFQEAMTALAKDRAIRGEPRAVLDYLMGRLTFENFIVVTQAEVAAELGMFPANVSRAIKLLVERGILELGPRTGNTRSYKLNPLYGWKGSVVELDRAKTARLKAIAGGKRQDVDKDQLTRATLESLEQQRLPTA